MTGDPSFLGSKNYVLKFACDGTLFNLICSIRLFGLKFSLLLGDECRL